MFSKATLIHHLRFFALIAALVILGDEISIKSSISSACPDSPNLSFTPTLSRGVGMLEDKYSATAPPNPPIILWSSAVTIAHMFLLVNESI